MTTARHRPSAPSDAGLELARELCVEFRALRLLVQQVVCELRARRKADDGLLRENNRLLRELLAELREQRAQRRRPSRAGLLAVIAATVEARLFTVPELFADAEVRTPALATALDAAGISTPRVLGKYLRSVEGRTIDGVRIIRIGEDRDGSVIWQCCGE